MHGSMKYMENYFELRVDPQKLVPGAKSIITLLINYFPSEKQNESSPKISTYAYGKDYHDVIKNKLQALLKTLHEKIGEVNGRGFVDSAPVLERSWAQRSGLGWIGKNGNLISNWNMTTPLQKIIAALAQNVLTPALLMLFFPIKLSMEASAFLISPLS